jgi:heme/copper-type cytochrome/quinol oxidase subunit 4
LNPKALHVQTICHLSLSQMSPAHNFPSSLLKIKGRSFITAAMRQLSQKFWETNLTEYLNKRFRLLKTSIQIFSSNENFYSNRLIVLKINGRAADELPLLEIHFNIIFPPTPVYNEASFSQETYIHFHSPHTCHMSSPFHLIWCDYPNNTCSLVQITTLAILQFSPVSCQFLHLGPKCSPQRLVRWHIQCVFLYLSIIPILLTPVLWTVQTRRAMFSNLDAVRQSPASALVHAAIWKQTNIHKNRKVKRNHRNSSKTFQTKYITKHVLH